MPVITAGDAVRHETPNAVMRTLAAPSTGARELSVWEVRMGAGHTGPTHTADHEQVWCVLAGELRARVGAETAVACVGDALLIAGGAQRRIEALTELTAIVSSPAAPAVTTPDSPVGRRLPWGA